MQTHPKARTHTIEVAGSGSPTHPWRVLSAPHGPLPCPSWPSEGMILKDEQLDGFFVKVLCPHCHYPAMLGAQESPIKAFRCTDQQFCGRTWGFEEMKRHTDGQLRRTRADSFATQIGQQVRDSAGRKLPAVMPWGPGHSPPAPSSSEDCDDCDRLHSSSRLEFGSVEEDVTQLTERMERRIASIVSDVDAGEWDIAAVQLSRLARAAVECAALVGRLKVLEDVIEQTDA